MAECIRTTSDFDNVRNAVCVSTKKIMDACRDQDCIENARVYLTRESQAVLENAGSVKVRDAKILFTCINVEPVSYRDGYYCVDIQYYYRVVGDATIGCVRPATVYGLATFGKRATLYGGEAGARTFTSACSGTEISFGDTTMPTAVVEAIDPVILCTRVEDVCDCHRHCNCDIVPSGIPEGVLNAFDDELIFTGEERRLLVTMGQFSMIRLERDTQLLIPSYDYCVPEKDCSGGDGPIQETPCEAFAQMAFPVSAFFPTAEGTRLCGECWKSDEPAPYCGDCPASEPTGCGCDRATRNGGASQTGGSICGGCTTRK